MMSGWESLGAAIETARGEIAALAPDAATAAEGEAYLMRVLSSSLAEGFLGHMLTEHGLTTAFPTRGGANPDYRLLASGIDPKRAYRIEGQINASERVGIGLYSYRPDGASLLAGYASFDAESVDADGRFALDLAADAAGPGALAIAPDVLALVARTLHREGGTPAFLALTGGTPPRDLSLPTGTVEGALAQTGQGVLRIVRQFLVWTQTTSAQPNWLGEPPEELGKTVLGTPDVRYILGYYLLGPGEWLEVTMPEGLAGYWGLQALNHWLETLPGAHVHDRNIRPDADGRIRIGVGPAVPEGVGNRIDTCGRTRGVLIGRLPISLDLPSPTARLCKPGE